MPREPEAAQSERECLLCRRVGTRGFKPSIRPGVWVCTSSAACERRVRGTGMVGVGVMRNYRA